LLFGSCGINITKSCSPSEGTHEVASPHLRHPLGCAVMTRTAVLTRVKVDELLTMGFAADELASMAATSPASIYARRKENPTRRSELDRRIGRLYLVVTEMHDFGLDDDQIIGWFTSPSLHLNADTPLERMERDQFKRVRSAAHAWMDGEPASAYQSRAEEFREDPTEVEADQPETVSRPASAKSVASG
jgi:hypothetical protein